MDAFTPNRREALRAGLLAGAGALALPLLSGFIPAEWEAVPAPPSGIDPVWLNQNTNALGPSPKAARAITAHMQQARLYAEAPALQLLEGLHQKHQLQFPYDLNNLTPLTRNKVWEDTHLLIGVGSTELVQAVARLAGQQGGNWVEADPTYTEVQSTMQAYYPRTMQRVAVPTLPDGNTDMEGMVKALRPDTRLVYLVNPENPRGTVVSGAAIRKLADALSPDTILLVDEAYIDFVQDGATESVMDLALSRPNVAVARTFSKVYGLAGMRVGYLVASKALVQRIRPLMLGRLAYNILSMEAAAASLSDTVHIQASIDLVNRQKEALTAGFAERGMKAWKSYTNFLWVNAGADLSGVVSKMAQQGVYIRAGGALWKQPNFIRVSIGTEEEMRRFWRVFDAVRAS